ncbi:Paralemmin-3 [Tupaia chinensis]|uniref:Paralemmin-3 n=2 Tax=Tupaia chinensis TaxID=246437 RepID=L8YGW6_TUPCH|nr:Paralemmin-3 [Tupaia chinensis]
MAESSLYRQRLEVIARKSLRERWLMDGAAEGPERPEDPTLNDPQSPEGQAQARIQNLEDSLFTLQSQLQLLQSASTGAQHKPSGRPTWRRQGQRPLSQPIEEAGHAGHTDVDKRSSLPAHPVSPESPSEPGQEAIGVLPTSRQVPGAVGAASEANGPYSGPSCAPQEEPSQRGVGDAKAGDVVEVVWEGLRATEDCAVMATGPELEAKVEEVVLEAIGARQGASSPELPAWVKDDREIVEVVWEGVGGGDSTATEEAAGTGSPRLQEGQEEVASREEKDAPRGSPEGEGQGGSGGEEGSFIWVERVTLSEDWEELLVEGPTEAGREGGGEETWEEERRKAEESTGIGEKGSEGEAGAEGDRAEMTAQAQAVERRGGEPRRETESRGGEDRLATEQTGAEEALGLERKDTEGPLRAEEERAEEKVGMEKEVERLLGVENLGEGNQEVVRKGEEPLELERKEIEGPLGAERDREEEKLEAEKEEVNAGVDRKEGDGEKEATEKSLVTKRNGGEGKEEEEKTQGVGEDLHAEQPRESGGEMEPQAEEVSKTDEESKPEEERLQPSDKQEGSLEEEVNSQTPAEGQGDATPLLAEIPAPGQPAECQPLLQREGSSANPSAHPAPTYAPARQPEPSAPAEGEEASGPKQKTCQCCVVM